MKKCIYKSTRPNPVGDLPRIDPTAYIDPSAQVIGHVQIGERVFVGPNVVLREDELTEPGTEASIVIGPECNVQDGVIMHSLAGEMVSIGARVSLAHGCIVHGPCSIGAGSFIGFRSTLFRASLGEGCFVGHGAIVHDVELPAGTLVPSGTVVTSQDAVARLPAAEPAEREFNKKVVATNIRLATGYLALQQERNRNA
jgi:carbonic anhydrase/acetyltransferase-like protein (isoleucine patch superfamily)